MSIKIHLPHRPGATEHPRPDGPVDEHSAEVDLVYNVQRTGAVCVGAFLLVFGLVGLAGGLGFFSTEGERILGLSSNGLLSAISIVVGFVLVGAAFLGPRVASTVMIVLGCLFLLSALVNLAVLNTDLNILAFEMRNVLFSIGVGLLLLVLGAYGRVSGNLPADSPYAHERAEDPRPPESYPHTPEEFAAEAAMREAEIAVSQHAGTEDQRRRVEAMAAVHTRGDRRRIWMEFDAAQARSAPPAPIARETLPEHRPVLARALSLVRGRQDGEARRTGK
ncbi:DUF4383 domain-containing protein [Modestobacter marinus]|uniref:DUF4383 domain-containing protein n=1 Tax=Modestobacter marinus TaxID=477641 RepID=UPI001C976803|nr:DUF4383 domain-containing protein [Modestobacter marinus]